MSRSYKKHPVIKDNGGTKKWWKKYSNNVCKQHDLPNGMYYKKLVERWNFCDYKWSLLGYSPRDWYYNGSSKYGGDWKEDMFRLRRK
jgi:hypothetical protein